MRFRVSVYRCSFLILLNRRQEALSRLGRPKLAVAVGEMEQPEDDFRITLAADDHADVPIRSDHLGLPLLARPYLERSQERRRLHQIHRLGTDPAMPRCFECGNRFLGMPRPVVAVTVTRGGLTVSPLMGCCGRSLFGCPQPDRHQPATDHVRTHAEEATELCLCVEFILVHVPFFVGFRS